MTTEMLTGWDEMPKQFVFTLFLLAVAIVEHSAVAEDAVPADVQFNRDIRPIFSDLCFNCHGPDSASRQADFRLDDEKVAFSDRGDYRAIVPGNLEKSELYRRLITEDESLRMPPPDFARQPTKEQIDLIRRWIQQGAEWETHWAFLTPKRPEIPAGAENAFISTPIDSFVLRRLKKEGLKPSPPANKTTLIRRVTFDLTGLPPTPEEIDAFLEDTQPGAYERLVDRLLASPRYGERMAADWLDAARYADTSGYQSDGPRDMWRWRDWVIDAYNANQPFDEFTIEQLAGDLLPNATLEQKIATGFNRNHRGNAEGGIIPEEFQVEYVVDRVETTATVWLGLTLGCARCHEHKYDPFTQEDFYKLYAYFNNIPEYGRARKEGNSPPYIQAPTVDQQQQLAILQAKVAGSETRWDKLQKQLDEQQAQWEKQQAASQHGNWVIQDGLIAQFGLDGNISNTVQSEEPKPKAKTVDSKAKTPAIGFHNGEEEFGPGQYGDAATLDGERYIVAGDVGDFGYFDKFSLAAWIHPQGTHGGTIISRMTDVARGDGYYVALVNGKIQVNLVKRWLDDSIRVESQHEFPSDRWYHIAVTYDGSRVAEGIRLYVDGQLEPLTANIDLINQSFASSEPLRIGGGGGPDGRFAGLIDDVLVYNRLLSDKETAILATDDTIDEIIAIPASKREGTQSAKLRSFYLAKFAPQKFSKAAAQVVSLRRELRQLDENLPTVMVMQDMQTPRETHVLLRGQYDKPGEQVAAAVPDVFGAALDGLPTNRLALAKWLVTPTHPLTARVAVNRYWQMYFGLGLVKTSEDFGSQGEQPSHPELLDWLATEFIRIGWDVKAMQKLIVTSATYQQSSSVTAALKTKDPENRLLARGPRFRLSAEMVRDQALAAAGLLVERVGGPSVKPYQPAGLWKEIATTTNYDQSTGADLYRRSLYTYWKRTVAPPSMMNFDASGREACAVLPSRTNTPLQALNLMNDVTFVEASRGLAERALLEAGNDDKARLSYAFMVVTARKPSPFELQVLNDGLQFHREKYQANKEAARNVIHVGESRPNKRLDPVELAAFTAVTGVILNLDEAITKE